tara:strand:- start:221 stop:583 length:363 start_codon:yes stop_codon:yes gene_type:complete
MLKHKHLIIRANVENPPKDEQAIVEWAKQLINNIGMKIMMGPYAKYCTMQGNRGLTCVTIIETSHIAIHAWDEEQPGLIQLDVYTCGDLNKDTVFESMQEFNPIKIDYKYLDRENELITI